LSFIPTLGTMILGLLAGGVLRSDRTPRDKVKWLAIAGIVCLIVGEALGWMGVCPVVKRIWTPSWTVFSGGWCFLILAGFYAIMDVEGRKSWAFPLVVIGMNSIAAYCIAHLFEGFVSKNLTTHLGSGIYNVLGAIYAPVIHGALVLMIFWLILY